MKTEEVGIAKEKGREMTIQTGGCRFCGQTAALEVPVDWTEEEIDEYATEKCDCSEAWLYAHEKEKKEKAAEIIDSLFEEEIKNEWIELEQIQFLNTCALWVIKRFVKKITVDISKKTKIVIEDGNKGIKIKREDKKHKESLL